MSAPTLSGPTAKCIRYILAREGPQTAEAVSKLLDLNVHTVRRSFKQMLDADWVHISGWMTQKTGPHAAIYSLGKGVEAEYPMIPHRVKDAERKRLKREQRKKRLLRAIEFVEIQPTTGAKRI